MKQVMIALLLFVTVPVFAHELRPAYLELHEEKVGEFRVLWKTPMRGGMRLALSPVFSGRMESLTPATTRQTDDAAVQMWRLKAIEPLRGQSVRIAGLAGTMTDALVRIRFIDGTTWIQRLTPGHPTALIPAHQSALTVASLYLKLGVEVGQLLFVAAVLSFIAAVRRVHIPLPRWMKLVPPYAIGGVAMFWVMQRIAAF